MFFGVLPDLFSWTIYLFYKIIKREKFGKPNISSIPKWVHVLYGITHSVFVFGIVGLILFLVLGFVPVYLWAWLIHILIDIPTHSRDFLPTPFLWPLSDWKFPGFSWGQKWFMVVNYAAIIIVFLIMVL